MEEKSDKLYICFVSILLIFIVFITYHLTLDFEFVWDDSEFLKNNVFLEKWSTIFSSFFRAETFAKSVEAQIYRPVRNVFWIIELKLFGKDSSLFHLVNICFHSLNSILVYCFFKLCVQIEKKISLIFAVLFAIHPLNTEVVCWIKSFDDILAVFFGMISMLSFYSYLKKDNRLLLINSCLCFLLSIFSKESAVFLLFVFLTLTYSLDTFYLKKKKKITILFCILFLLYFFMRSIVLKQFGQTEYLAGSFFKTQLGMSWVYFKYLGSICVPIFQRVNYLGYSPYDVFHAFSLFLIWCFLSVVFLSLFKVFKQTRKELLFVIFSFLPVANLIPMMQWQAERFIYFPMIFMFLYLAKTIHIYLKYCYQRKMIIVLLFCIPVLMFLTIDRSMIWRNNKSIGISMLSSDEQSYHGLLMLMRYNNDNGYHQENIGIGEKYLKKFPNEEFIYSYLIIAYLKEKKYYFAKQIIKQGLSYFPESIELNNYWNKLNVKKFKIE